MPKNTNLNLVLISLWLLMFASSSQFFIMAPILPQLGTQLNIPGSIQGTLVSAYAFALGISALFIGPVSDKIGRRNILIIGSVSMAISLGLHPLAYDYPSMLILRLAAGVSGGVLTGSIVSYIRDIFPYERRGWANGMVATGSAAGQILGIPIGTILASEIGFETPFLFFAAVMGVAFVMILNFVPHCVNTKPNQKITFSSFSLKNYGQVLQNKHFANSALGYILMFFSISMFMVYFPTWLEKNMHYSTRSVALILSVGGLATLIGSPIAGKLTDQLGRKSITVINNLGMALSIAFLVAFNHSIISLLTLTFCTMFFLSGRLVSYQALISDITKDVSRGRFMCLSISLGQIGMGLGSFFSGFIYEHYSFTANVAAASVACILMAANVMFFHSFSTTKANTQEITAEIS